jgi:hypothetical protein
VKRAFDAALRRSLSEGLQQFERMESEAHQAPSLKRAAVAIVVIEGDDPADAAFVLTRRTSKLRNHAGQWALPGGRLDEGESPVQAALREEAARTASELSLQVAALEGERSNLFERTVARSH